jgi:hypothetical protein
VGIVAQAVPATTSGSVCHSPCGTTIRSIPRYNASVTSLMTAPAGSLAIRRRLAGVARRHCAITASGTGTGMTYNGSAPNCHDAGIQTGAHSERLWPWTTSA